MAKLTKDVLIKAHDNIDKVVGIEPPIDSNLTAEKYEKELFKTLEQLELTKEEIKTLDKTTQDVITQLNAKYKNADEDDEEEEEVEEKPAKKGAAAKTKKQTVPDPDDDEDEDDDEEEEEEPVKPAKKKAEPEKAAKKPAKKPEPEPDEDDEEEEEEPVKPAKKNSVKEEPKKAAKKVEQDDDEDEDEEEETSLYDTLKVTKKFDELKELVANNDEFKKLRKKMGDYKNPILLKKAMMDILIEADPSLAKAKEDKPKKEKKEKRTGPSLTEQRIEFYTPLIEKAKFTKAQLIEKGLANFEGVQKSALQTFLTDSKNPKYNKFPQLVVEDAETKIMSFKKSKK